MAGRQAVAWRIARGWRATNAQVQKVPWWRDAVGYSVYLRSFADTTGNGVGDLAGVTDDAVIGKVGLGRDHHRRAMGDVDP